MVCSRSPYLILQGEELPQHFLNDLNWFKEIAAGQQVDSKDLSDSIFVQLRLMRLLLSIE